MEASLILFAITDTTRHAGNTNTGLLIGLILALSVLVGAVVWLIFYQLRKKRVAPLEEKQEPGSLPEEWAEAAKERAAFFREFETRLDDIRKKNPARLSSEERQEVEGMNTVLLGMRAMGEQWGAREHFYMGFTLGINGWLAIFRGDRQEAERFFRQAADNCRKATEMARYDPDFHNGLSNTLSGLGWVLLEGGNASQAQGLFKSAIRSAEMALQLKVFADARCNLGLAWEGMSMTQTPWKAKKSLSRAINSYTVAIEMDPEHDLAREYLERATARLSG